MVFCSGEGGGDTNGAEYLKTFSKYICLLNVLNVCLGGNSACVLYIGWPVEKV